MCAKQKIVFVSRLDKDCSLGAYLLCEIAPKLARKIPNLEINIIGGGTEYGKILLISKKINDDFAKVSANRGARATSLPTDGEKHSININHKLINLIGKVENVPNLLSKISQSAPNTLFVGVSRAALEAMAQGIPVILLGDEGYLGLIDENKLASARKNNFTCRSSGFGSGCDVLKDKNRLKSAIFNEICRYFELPEEERARLSRLVRQEIEENYSAEKMAQMTLEVYIKTIDRYCFCESADAVVDMNVDADAHEDVNAEAEAELGVNARRFARPRAPANSHFPTGLCESADFRSPAGLRAPANLHYPTRSPAHANSRLFFHGSPKIVICGYYGRANFGDEAILKAILRKIEDVFSESSVLEAYENAEILILTEKDPTKILKKLKNTDLFIFGGGSLLQNHTSRASLLYYLSVIALARLMSKRTVMLSNGIGPIVGGGFERKLLLGVLARLVATFDFISVRDTYSQKLLESLVSQRKIHLIFDPAVYDVPNIIEESARTPNRYFIFCPCARGLVEHKIDARKVANALLELEEEHRIEAKLLVLNKQEDISFAREVEKLLGGARIVLPGDEDELCGLLFGASFVISQRYHGTVFATCCGVPTLSLSSDPKMHAFCKDFCTAPALSPKILSNTDALRAEISAVVLYHKKNSHLIDKKVRNAALLTDLKLKKCLKKFIFPIDNDEQMFYNIEKGTGRTEKWLKTRKETR